MTIPEDEIPTAQVVYTIVGGEGAVQEIRFGAEGSGCWQDVEIREFEALC